jgi:hypothetical protein
MFENLKQEWRLLKEGKPGSRFQRIHEARSSDKSRSGAGLLVGALVIAAGIVALPLPGPGFLIIGLGTALVARESATAARIADRIEARVRK